MAETEAAPTVEAVSQPNLAKRPSGYGPLVCGMILLGLGAIVLAIGVAMKDFTSDGISGIIPPTYNAAKWPTIWVGLGMMNLGFALWCLGQILRALFFLPGREVNSEELL